LNPRQSLYATAQHRLQGCAQVKVAVGPDEHITFNHLRKGHKNFQLELMDEVASDLQLATGLVQTSNTDSPSLTRTLQLSGL
jgi:hypothetical protein